MVLENKKTKFNISNEVIESHGLTIDDYSKIIEIIGRQPNLVELGIFSVMWSEHCSYKSTKFHLKKLYTESDCVICGPGENAGIIDIGDNQAVIFKMESHNHPSFIEPYQGAATGVGGIMRDVFTMGARPIANMNALRFGELANSKTKFLLSGVVSGIGGYGNCMGVPTVGGECNFYPEYNGNILVNAMCVGLADKDKIFYSAASDVGASVVYVGAKTGRDGIHGATMASAEFNDESESKRPTVQVGDPFTEKLLLEACLELMSTDAILSIQDMGAAGLTCSSLEMADKGGTGIELNLDYVPQREKNMTAYDIMLSESQERMLMVIKPEKEDQARKIFEKWDIDFAIVGKITDTGRIVVKKDNVIEVDMPVAPLADSAPEYERPYKITKTNNIDFILEQEITAEDALLKLLSSPNICSKKWIAQQYDSTVMNDTISTSDADASLVRVHNTNKALAVSVDVNPRYCFNNPEEGGKHAVIETWRNITATGAKPLAITNCLNFGNPEKENIMGQIVGCLQGMNEACKSLDYPIISGNVSLYNETDGNAILPTPTIGGVGLLVDIDNFANIRFKDEGQLIYIIGQTEGHLGASTYLDVIEKNRAGDVPPISIELEKQNGDYIRDLIQNHEVRTCHDISDGGLYVAIAEMILASQIGAVINLDDNKEILFGEDQARYIIAINADQKDEVLKLAQEKNIYIQEIGYTKGRNLVRKDQEISYDNLHNAYENTLPDFYEFG